MQRRRAASAGSVIPAAAPAPRPAPRSPSIHQRRGAGPAPVRASAGPGSRARRLADRLRGQPQGSLPRSPPGLAAAVSPASSRSASALASRSSSQIASALSAPISPARYRRPGPPRGCRLVSHGPPPSAGGQSSGRCHRRRCCWVKGETFSMVRHQHHAHGTSSVKEVPVGAAPTVPLWDGRPSCVLHLAIPGSLLVYLKPSSALGGSAPQLASHSGQWHLQGTEGSLSALQAAGCEVQLFDHSTWHRKVHLAKGTDGGASARQAEWCPPCGAGSRVVPEAAVGPIT